MPHLLTPKIYNTPKESLGILKWLCAEMERRYALFAKRFVAKISSYNATKEVMPFPSKSSAPTLSSMVRLSVPVVTAKAILVGKLALMLPVITSTDGLCVAKIK